MATIDEPHRPRAAVAGSAPLVAAEHAGDGKQHLLLAATGSVATIKLPSMVGALLAAHGGRLAVVILLTDAAARFLDGQSAEQPSLAALAATPGVQALYTDADEWAAPWTRGAPILHIELRRWADLLVVAPLSADALARIVAGLSDGLLLSVVRAWDTAGDIDDGPKKRIIVAPAMNTAMWHHPLTRQQVRVLEAEWGVGGQAEDGAGAGAGWVEVLRPVEKELACGDVGDGAMHDWRDIVSVIEHRLGLGQ